MGANLRDATVFGWGAEYGLLSASSLPLGWEGTLRHAAPQQPKQGQDTDSFERDWAGVEDLPWRGTYAFLDYRVFSHFNFHRTRNVMPSLEGEDEAVGDCMTLDIKLLPAGQLPLPPDHAENAFLSDYDEEEDEDFDIDDAASSSSSNSAVSDSSFIRRAHQGNMLGIGTREGSREASPEASASINHGSVHDEEGSSTLGDRACAPLAYEFDKDSHHALASKPVVAPINPAVTSNRPDFQISPPHDARPSASNTPQPKHSATPESQIAGRRSFEPLHFAGGFGGVRHATHMNRSIRGTVKMTSDGQVHWRYIIRYAGRDQWLMNGVQIGGPRSKYGVVGYWTAADHEEESPGGPFWYFQHHAHDPDLAMRTA
ncbi:hypothetical protein OIV83_003414 [Microbotryomycetes sp. JL201]|nr:hypothetical protein OIV83_003414 [Microbotryomycetes sp. JL201]